ncbi:hypothetical protein HPQ64_07205 [Rhizobiales bacterium]|uniref:hypothetical protein n=1 Tax=Hongsoonwoonella zoysiae TaxID=2821844 RepID=UPI0015603E39|nr:hypothetical protein [Hongsoonwoonella zoysiae]NRG17470.1 hypothetical protein [Hongsoonwoonella zoysiae]
MLLGLLGTLVLGIAIGGVLTAAYRLSGRRLPKWIIPVGAALGMIIFHAWNEYTWFSRTVAGLPPHVQVGQTYTVSNAIQPWTLLFPRIDRFSAVDLGSVRTNDKAPGYRLAQVHLVTRFSPTGTTRQLFDCNEPRRMVLGEETEFNEEGLPKNPDWEVLPANDPLLEKVCSQPVASG